MVPAQSGRPADAKDFQLCADAADAGNSAGVCECIYIYIYIYTPLCVCVCVSVCLFVSVCVCVSAGNNVSQV